MTQLPDFKLEVYLGKWEFAARWHMTPSDAQTLDKGLQNLREGKYDPPVTPIGTGSPQTGQTGK